MEKTDIFCLYLYPGIPNFLQFGQFFLMILCHVMVAMKIANSTVPSWSLSCKRHPSPRPAGSSLLAPRARTTAQRVGLKKCGAVEELVHLLQMTYSEARQHGRIGWLEVVWQEFESKQSSKVQLRNFPSKTRISDVANFIFLKRLPKIWDFWWA